MRADELISRVQEDLQANGEFLSSIANAIVAGPAGEHIVNATVSRVETSGALEQIVQRVVGERQIESFSGSTSSSDASQMQDLSKQAVSTAMKDISAQLLPQLQRECSEEINNLVVRNGDAIMKDLCTSHYKEFASALAEHNSGSIVSEIMQQNMNHVLKNLIDLHSTELVGTLMKKEGFQIANLLAQNHIEMLVDGCVQVMLAPNANGSQNALLGRLKSEMDRAARGDRILERVTKLEERMHSVWSAEEKRRSGTGGGDMVQIIADRIAGVEETLLYSVRRCHKCRKFYAPVDNRAGACLFHRGKMLYNTKFAAPPDKACKGCGDRWSIWSCCGYCYQCKPFCSSDKHDSGTVSGEGSSPLPHVKQ